MIILWISGCLAAYWEPSFSTKIRIYFTVVATRFLLASIVDFLECVRTQDQLVKIVKVLGTDGLDVNLSLPIRAHPCPFVCMTVYV